MGLASIDELRSRSSHSIMADYFVEDERGAIILAESKHPYPIQFPRWERPHQNVTIFAAIAIQSSDNV